MSQTGEGDGICTIGLGGSTAKVGLAPGIHLRTTVERTILQHLGIILLFNLFRDGQQREGPQQKNERTERDI